MPLPYNSIQSTINIARISQYLMAADRANDNAFGTGYINLNTPSLVRVVRESLEWAYGRNPTDITLIPISNYLYELCAKYAGTALAIANLGNSGIVVNPSTGSVTSVVATQFQFTVGQIGALIAAGQTVLTLLIINPIKNSQLVIYNGSVLGINLSDRISYTVTYNTNSVVIVFNQAVSNGDLIQVNLSSYAIM